jgi:ABC-type oligopeptide transport system substrate-binding subunit
MMNLKKRFLFAISILALTGATFLTGCAEKSDADKAIDAAQEAGDNAVDAAKGLTD